jgi:RhtB (resistance to homoserine/threonine) family protein
LIEQAFTIGILMLFAVVLPGPDFAIVTKNTLLHSRRSGFFTALGITIANLIHMLYCTLGLALIISQSLLMFSIIKYIGASYLIYLGFKLLLAKKENSLHPKEKQIRKNTLSAFVAFRQGFLCNLLNPKATLFFLALFTTIIKPDTPPTWVLSFVLEMFLIISMWFFSLTLILSHPKVTQFLDKTEKYIEKILGAFLVTFGIALAFVKND